MKPLEKFFNLVSIMKKWLIENWFKLLTTINTILIGFLILYKKCGSSLSANSITAIFTVVLAIATIWLVYETKTAWKKEEKEKRIYDLNKEAYTLMCNIEEKINEASKMETEGANAEDQLDYFMCDYFRGIKNEIINLYRKQNWAIQNLNFLEYFKDIIEKYSKKASDEFFYNPWNPETGENNEDYFLNNFWSDYEQQQDKEPWTGEFQLKFDEMLKKAKDYYDDELIKFYS